MKKIKFTLVLAFLLSFGISAQNNSLSLEFSNLVGTNYGVTLGYQSDKEDAKKNETGILKVYYINDVLESSTLLASSINGNGFGFEIGERTFFKKDGKNGFYGGSSILYGNINFTDDATNFDGKYEYLSIFSPEFGYQLDMGSNLSLNLHVGTSWLIEIKSRGDIDNRDFENWVLRAGVGLGYRF